MCSPIAQTKGPRCLVIHRLLRVFKRAMGKEGLDLGAWVFCFETLLVSSTPIGPRGGH